jgi:hypothetical protein
MKVGIVAAANSVEPNRQYCPHKSDDADGKDKQSASPVDP